VRQDPISKKTLHKRLAEWLKVKAISSNPSTAKKKAGNRISVFKCLTRKRMDRML
jgi:hypothetical protein